MGAVRGDSTPGLARCSLQPAVDSAGVCLGFHMVGLGVQWVLGVGSSRCRERLAGELCVPDTFHHHPLRACGVRPPYMCVCLPIQRARSMAGQARSADAVL